MKCVLFFSMLLVHYVLFVHPFSATAQHAGPWDQTYGSSNEDELTSSIPTADGGYLLAGSSYRVNASDEKVEADYWIVKTDHQGNQQWDQTIGGNGNDFLMSVITTQDGGYLLGGYSSSNASGDKSDNSKGGADYWIVKVDENGNKQWDQTLGGDDTDHLAHIIATEDGGYLLAGTSDSDASGDKREDSRGFQDYWVIKVDAEGKKQWDQTLGGDDLDHLASIITTEDGGYLLAGTSFSGASGDKSEPNTSWEYSSDYWIVKTDQQGNKQWDQTLGGDDFETLTSVIATDDGGYLLGGSSTSNASGDKSEDNKYFCDPGNTPCDTDYWIVKVDQQGRKQWDRTLGGYLSDDLASLTASPDGGYLLAGTSSSRASADKSEANLGSCSSQSNCTTDYWVIKINRRGRKIWDQTLGGDGTEKLSSIIITADGGYLLAGSSDSDASGDKGEDSQGGTDFWIVKQWLTVNTITLVNAENNKDVLTLKEGDVINLALLGNKPLNFRANTYPEKPGSVRFKLEGPVEHEQTENYYPFALFGDEPGLDYHGKHLVPGEYTLTATVYEQAQMKGNPGSSMTIHFTVEDRIGVERLTFYDADESFYDLFTVEDGDVIDLTEFKDFSLTIVANTYPREVEKVKFELQGPISHVQEDKAFPYSLFGDYYFGEFFGDFEGRQWLPGKYTLTVTPYTLYGPATPHTISFQLVTQVEIASFSLINATDDEEIGELKDGDVVDLSDFKNAKLTVGANLTSSDVDQVKFELDGPMVYSSTERYWPYALFGDEPSSTGRDYVGLTFLPGEYTLTATPYAHQNEGMPYTISFSVVGNSHHARTGAEQLQIEVFPVPTSGMVNIIPEGAEEGANMILIDQSGNVVLTKRLGKQSIEQLDLSSVKKGLYYLKVVSKEEVQVKRLVVE